MRPPKYTRAGQVETYQMGGIPGIAGKVCGYRTAVLPYARVWIIAGSDTIKLTCDALGLFVWKTPRVPGEYKIRAMAEGFETFELSNKAFVWLGLPGDWFTIFPPRVAKELNKVTIFADKVQFIVRGDTTEYKVDAFKTFEGDWAGDLLRKFPGVSTANGVLTMNGEPIHMVDVDNWKKFNFGMRFVWDNLRKERKLQKELQKSEKKKRKKDKPV